MDIFTGTGRLVRLALRRERITMPVWIMAIAGLVAASAPAVIELYGSSAQDRSTYATTTAASIITRVFGGPINGPDLGAIVLNETYLFAVVMGAFMSTLMVVRHTRQNEETGRAELIGSAVVGRHASLTAALLTAGIANVIIGIIIALILQASDLETLGSWATGAAIAATGLCFAALAAITAQFSEYARGANSLAALGIGISFVLRGIGDTTGSLADNGMRVVSTWPSWLSPIGWGQQIHPYTEQRWEVFGLFAVGIIGLVGLAFFLTGQRDVGMGIIPSKPGPARGAPGLLSTLGLAWRLQKGILRGWAIGIAVMGVVIGLIVKEFQSMLDENEAFRTTIEQLGGTGKAADALLGAMFVFTALAIAAYAIQAMQRLRSEEVNGQLEPILATGTSRYQWLASHTIIAVSGSVILCLIMGLTSGVAYVLSSDVPWSNVAVLTAAALNHLPAVLVMIGLSLCVFGWMPAATVAVTWGVLGACIALVQIGALLNLPQWAINLSPFSHLAAIPSEDVALIPIGILTALAGVCIVIGTIGFRQRDIRN